MSLFKLPDLGEGLADAKILEWHVKELEHIKTDQPLVSVETAKSVIEIPSPETGVVKKIYGAAGESIEVHSPLVLFDLPEVVKAMPAARKLAKEHNIDLSKIKTSNTITVKDVEKYINNNTDNNRKAMTYNMQQAYNNVVPATIHEDINLRLWSKSTDITARVIQAIAYGLEKNPIVNSTFSNNKLTPCTSINIGLAVQKETGLYVPNITITNDNCDTAFIRQKIEAIKLNNITNTEQHSIIYSNIGSISGSYSNPVLVPPAVVILATGKIRQKVVAVDGEIKICPIMPISLTFDHRAITGAEAAMFIKSLEQDLSQVESNLSQKVAL